MRNSSRSKATKNYVSHCRLERLQAGDASISAVALVAPLVQSLESTYGSPYGEGHSSR